MSGKITGGNPSSTGGGDGFGAGDGQGFGDFGVGSGQLSIDTDSVMRGVAVLDGIAANATTLYTRIRALAGYDPVLGPSKTWESFKSNGFGSSQIDRADFVKNFADGVRGLADGLRDYVKSCTAAEDNATHIARGALTYKTGDGTTGPQPEQAPSAPIAPFLSLDNSTTTGGTPLEVGVITAIPREPVRLAEPVEHLEGGVITAIPQEPVRLAERVGDPDGGATPLEVGVITAIPQEPVRLAEPVRGPDDGATPLDVGVITVVRDDLPQEPVRLAERVVEPTIHPDPLIRGTGLPPSAFPETGPPVVDRDFVRTSEPEPKTRGDGIIADADFSIKPLSPFIDSPPA
ncbi:hypothetical protein [Lentzea sp. NBRC 102530]|uniref:hypothetical protein n=1 Tax=Lentzea sp. NBRC 102530 TaxID=3032201 RepID=UPI0024A29C00|nr:hypothetical protein [Lentzea sp. NBRC 102530]GLY55374.1 hypothetical protein Lesp01_90290 [Lentzea sp. NBRC 102530]